MESRIPLWMTENGNQPRKQKRWKRVHSQVPSIHRPHSSTRDPGSEPSRAQQPLSTGKSGFFCLFFPSCVCAEDDGQTATAHCTPHTARTPHTAQPTATFTSAVFQCEHVTRLHLPAAATPPPPASPTPTFFFFTHEDTLARNPLNLVILCQHRCVPAPPSLLTQTLILTTTAALHHTTRRHTQKRTTHRHTPHADTSHHTPHTTHSHSAKTRHKSIKKKGRANEKKKKEKN